ncbi:hypothetical protein [Aliikangiella sp. G2MR2-5]|uniref:hypothetical protein n=1 Tax=Aliikangiella sp. G2MR2-5 TaxID=2788943 RepID=UPI0018A9866E|nr:hypothetical protein [Aliikangiella sp. G2MR2-5]
MTRRILIPTIVLALSGCSLEMSRTLLGYQEPPPKTTIGEELVLEYERCVKIGQEKNCAQAAFDVVRVVKGLEPRKVPKGIVIILEGDGGHGDESENESDDSKKTKGQKIQEILKPEQSQSKDKEEGTD